MASAKFKLLHFPATRSARVKWVLHEVLGDDFEIEKVDLYSGKQYSPEHIAINPNHNVPVLEITWANGETQRMLESAAMVAFLADAYPKKKLAPPANELSPARADYLQMLHFGASWMDMMLWQIRIHEHLLPESQFDERTIARYKSKFTDEVEPQIAARVEKGPFICGEEFTAADCIVGHNVMWARAYGLCKHRAFDMYALTLSKREGFQKAFSDIGDFSPAPPGGRREGMPFNG
ncbi:MAG: glutathione S-transferase family protein [Marinicaulis sp.]|nr:glutathione S-transferase family protein [Marinicaulis sp.]NNE39644.1 glutathione S-transferase family protein [Marinicaulis sp.]NNL90392.1 glutathione S-transferase family protein [Marinicaulis sp.]